MLFNTELTKIFSHRARLSPIERLLYTTDVGNVPDIIDIMVDRFPSCVVQPENVDEVVKLVRLARKEKVPIVPRGAGTSGAGGVIPVKGGIVIDFSRMNRVLEIDEKNQTVTVEPGVVFQQLDENLNTKGLSLRIYPSSAPSATVAGWLSAGGVGYGSLEYGTIRDNVEMVELVTGEGEVKSLSGEELELVADCCGITGLVVKLKLKIKKFENIIPVAIRFFDIELMNTALLKFVDSKLQLWTCGFESAEFIKLKNIIAEAEGREKLPEFPTVVVAFPEHRKNEIISQLTELIAETRGVLLPDNVAKELWAERFYPLRIKRLGPTVIPGEVYLPPEKIAQFLTRVSTELAGEAYSFEGTLAKTPEIEAVVRLWVLDDERREGFELAWSHSFKFLRLAKKFGGRTYQVGMYLTSEAETFFGTERLKKIRQFKLNTDSEGILNPGKIFTSSSKLSRFLPLGKLIELGAPLMELGKPLFISRHTEDYMSARARKEPDLTEAPYLCARCSYCRAVCPLYNELWQERISQRAKLTVAKNILLQHSKPKSITNIMMNFLITKFAKLPEIPKELNQEIIELANLCSCCGYCEEVCQTKLPLIDVWEEARALVARKGLMPAHEKIGSFAVNNANPYGEDRGRRSAWIPPELQLQTKGEIGYFSGCTAAYRIQSHAKNTVKIFSSLGIPLVYLGSEEYCCGSPLIRTGQVERAEKLMEHNIHEINARGITTLVFTCPGCTMTFTRNYPRFAKKYGLRWEVKVIHITEFIASLLKDQKLVLKTPVNSTVTYHDPCHIGRHMKIYDAPRSILKAIPGLKFIEMKNIREKALCCGAGGGMRAAFPEYANALAYKRLIEAKETGASTLVSSCGFCELSFNLVKKDKKLEIDVKNITDLVIEAM